MNNAQRSFALGEVSPTLHARADLAAYQRALRTLRNGVVSKEGGIVSRAGTLYKGTAKSATVANVTRLIDCQFSSSQAYVLELGNLYLRFWLNGVQVTFSAPSAWSVASVSYVAGDLVSHGGTNYLCILANTSGAGNEPGTGGGAEEWYAQTGVILEWPTSYATADLFRIKHKHPDATSVVLVHPSYAPKRLTRVAATNWTFATITLSSDLAAPTNLAVSGTNGSGWGYAITAIDAAGVESAATSYVRTNITVTDLFSLSATLAAANRTVTWDAVTGAVKYKIYATSASTEVIARILGETTTNSYVDYGQWIFDPTVGLPPTSSGLFASTDNYPGAVAVHQQRLLLGGTNNKPDVVYASRSGDPLNFSARSPIQDDDMMSWRHIGPRVDRVLDLLAVAEQLVGFGETAETFIRGDTDSILRPGEVNPQTFSHNGIAANLSPLPVNDTALYVQARGGVVRSLWPQEGGQGSDLSVTAFHLVRGYTVTDWCFQQTPYAVAWMVRSDGALLSLTYARETGIVGWAHHDTDGSVESVACVTEGAEDVVYLMVRRTIDGNAARYIERLANRVTEWPDTVCMDSAVVAVEA